MKYCTVGGTAIWNDDAYAANTFGSKGGIIGAKYFAIGGGEVNKEISIRRHML